MTEVKVMEYKVCNCGDRGCGSYEFKGFSKVDFVPEGKEYFEGKMVEYMLGPSRQYPFFPDTYYKV